MLSLDQKIIDPQSAVASRMRAYEHPGDLYILVPASHDVETTLSEQCARVG